MPKNEEQRLKIISTTCPQCGAKFEVDETNEKMTCDYCGTQFIVTERFSNADVPFGTWGANTPKKEEKKNALDSVFDFVKHQQNRADEENKRLEEERKASEEKTKAHMKKFWWAYALAAVACFGLLFFMLVQEESNQNPNEITISTAAADFKGQHYEDVVTQLELAGFTNIETAAIEDLVTGWLTDDGEVENVVINGDSEFGMNDRFLPDAQIVVRYHTFAQVSESDSLAVESSASNAVEENGITSDASYAGEASSDAVSSQPANEILTVENNEDLARLFTTGDFDPFISEFARKYDGRTIQFDGYIAEMSPHGTYDTRYDILIYTGNSGESSGNALSFKFSDKNIFDLNLVGSNVPDYMGEGDNLRVTAIVEGYSESSGLFDLEPVTTEFR